MSVWSILLRVLLSLALILNGSGYAMASTHMSMGHTMDMMASSPEPAADAVATAEPPCHQHHGGDQSIAQVKHPATANDTAPPEKSEHPSTDCCKSGACRCPCVHHAQVVVPAFACGGAVIAHTSSVRPLTLGHPAPALPHLIRPPIG